MIKKFLVFFKNLLISTLIALISVSIIILTVVLLITKYDVFLKYAGIYIEKECRFDKGSFYCRTYVIRDRNNRINLNFKNLSGSIVLANFLKNREIFYVNSEYISGYIKLKTGEKKERQSLPLNLLFMLLRFMSFSQENGNLVLFIDKREINIKNLNFSIKNTELTIGKPIYVENPNFNLHINKAEVKLSDNRLFFKNIESNLLDGIYIEASGVFDSNMNVSFNGFTRIKHINLYENDVQNEYSFFKIWGRAKQLNFVKLYTVERIINERERAVFKGLYGRLKGTISKVVEGNNFVSIDKVNILDITGGEIHAHTRFILDKKEKRIDTDIRFSSLSFGRYTLTDVISKISVEKDKFISVSGNVKTKILNANFSYSTRDEPIFKLKTDMFKLEKIVDFINPQRRNLFHLYGNINLDLEYRPLTDTATVKINGNGMDLFGIKFKEGTTLLSVKVEKNEADISGRLQGSQSNLFFAGKYKKRFLNIEYNYSNINIKNLIFTKKAGFSAVLSGKGVLKGVFPNIEIILYGKSSVLSYREIKLQDINYALFYKNKKLTVVGESADNSTTTNVFVNFKPFSMLIDIYGYDSNLQPVNPYMKTLLPNVFTKLEFKKGTGNVKIYVKRKFWKVDINIERGESGLIPLKESIYGSAKGTISKEKTKLNVYFENPYFNLYGKKSSIKGEFELLNRDFFLQISSNRLDGVKKFKSFLFLFTELERKRVSGVSWIDTEEKGITLKSRTLISGNFEKVGGISKLIISKNEEKVLDATVNYLILTENEKIRTEIFSNNLSLSFSEKEENALLRNLSVLFGRISVEGNFQRRKSPTFRVKIEKLTIEKSNIPVISAEELDIYADSKEIRVEPTQYTGFLSGKLSTFRFSITDNRLKLFTEGYISKEIIPQILQFFSLKGELKYSVTYDDTLKDFNKKIVLKLKSDNLEMKTPYVVGKILLDKFLVEYSKILSINIKGKTVNTLYGENPLSVTGTVEIKPLKYSLYAKSDMLPIRYENLFVGTASTDVFLTGEKGSSLISGSISVSGRSKISPAGLVFEKEEKKPDILENVSLDIYINTFSPIYIYGGWGNVYAEGNLHITGTASKPVLNGEINITYGKIYIAKNLYNVDFINVRIIDNKAFVNARLSTTVAQTFIYLNITGPIDDLQFDYVSTPPKTKEEILAILFLKETPSALAELPVFALIGKIIRVFFPLSKEGEGIFQTGFEVSINPKYSPIQGIIASIYARKSITRRLYIALSRPIIQALTELGGWYELGFKLTERTAIVFRQYETNISETEITFTLPFDF